MQKMNAVGLFESLPAENEESLQNIEVEKPSPQGRDILVEVKAVSINPVDTKVRGSVKEKLEEPKILGYDAAGVVVATGEEVSLFSPGDEVYYAGSVGRQGTNSEFHLVDERITAKKPSNLDFAEAAALPLTTITAWEAIYERMHVSKDPEQNKGKTMLIIGAAGGVGSIAVQIAKQAGLQVIGTASRDETKEWVKARGADHLINHHHNFKEQLQELSINEVDYIFCLHSTDMHWEAMVEVAAPQSYICAIVDTAEKVDLALLKQKSITFAWEFMFTRPLFTTPDMIEQHHLLTDAASLVEKGELATTMTERLKGFDAENFRKGHQLLEEGKMIGKLVIEK
ncbi:zinc-binding alcohol dehydrogenase family protein [Alkalicoccus daliensis]|uniref:Zinc-type alcohol dehydrogenase-like protein n=1 Tax=Alkalicoccus daliensis TaxID=745820 RepID=A0A1H0FVG4_9BACI|nr:zinc-binding alcohol dehydrogenase family protein [Alkalicoccus daliensis]SDN98668.1 zinc-binding alcohol dehydrogenase family protein [Alkalicoccus daliensis]